MAKHGDAKVPLVLTEFGWPSFNSDEYKRLGANKIAAYQARSAQTAIAELTYEQDQAPHREHLLVHLGVTRHLRRSTLSTTPG